MFFTAGGVLDGLLGLSLSLSLFGICEASLGCTSGPEGHKDTSSQLTEAS